MVRGQNFKNLFGVLIFKIYRGHPSGREIVYHIGCSNIEVHNEIHWDHNTGCHNGRQGMYNPRLVTSASSLSFIPRSIKSTGQDLQKFNNSRRSKTKFMPQRPYSVGGAKVVL